MRRAELPAQAAALRLALPLIAALALSGCARARSAEDEQPDAATRALLAYPDSSTARVVAVPDTVARAAAVDSAPSPLDPSLFSEWTDFDAACVRSRALGVPVMLAFRADWAEACQSLQHDVFDHAARGVVVKSLVVPVAVQDRSREDGRNIPAVEGLIERFHVETYPTVVVYSPVTGHVARRQGYEDPDAFLGWLEQASHRVTGH